LEVKKLDYDVHTIRNKRNSLEQEVEVLQAQIEQQRHTIQSLKAKRDNAKINLDLTIVRAPSDGVIDNMYVSPNTPIKIHEPIFSFIDTANYYIQANFNETDLRNVRIGDKAFIILRMYYFDKVFHGVVVNSLWAAERQKTAPKSQIQLVRNENEWLLLPQRFPLQIKILDLDPQYPLNPGASAYVYIATKR
jgi:multidrug resistance efflux pump